ncbi:hypothetical protein HPULCUR_006485 [Helicostylum pulchrum]|uniref:Uncharacterized protein n=1 Tax=Helicostylum pulchrum TaxID=562976 RepID=A0ABP9Y224_9FUNG
MCGTEARRGSIFIDGIDIKYLGKEDLYKLTINPQDPTFFSGSFRSNIDHFYRFTDDDIFTALRLVQLLHSKDLDSVVSDLTLNEVNANVFKDIETSVTEGSKYFS